MLFCGQLTIADSGLLRKNPPGTGILTVSVADPPEVVITTEDEKARASNELLLPWLFTLAETPL